MRIRKLAFARCTSGQNLFGLGMSHSHVVAERAACERGGGSSLADLIGRLRSDETGQGAVEYILIAALVALASVAGMADLARGLNDIFTAASGPLGNYINP